MNRFHTFPMYALLRETIESYIRKNFREVIFDDYFELCTTTNYWYVRKNVVIDKNTKIYTCDKWKNFGFVFDNRLYFARKQYEEVNVLAYFDIFYQAIVPDYASIDQLNKLLPQMNYFE